MKEQIGLEIKVGLMALIGLIVLAILVFSIGDYNFFQKRKQINLVFNYAGGVEESAPVRLAGVKIGEVHSVALVPVYDQMEQKTGVQVRVWLDRSIDIYENADVYVNTLGLLGEKYIEILTPGTTDQPLVKHGGILRGHDPVPIEKITQSTHEIVGDLRTLLGGLNDVVGDEEFRESLKTTVYHFETTADNLRDATSKMRAGEGSLGNFVYNDSLYNELDGFAREIRKNPWKLLKKPKTDEKEAEQKGGDSNRGFLN
ncbi:MAG: MCE family protein [Candidatus Omnitrophica bacterium]|nr:MCE family protein [Candidatus Omnitrophota bacterium]